MRRSGRILRFARPNRYALAFVFASLTLVFTVSAQEAVDLSGTRISPLQESRGKVLVLVFVRTDCPISNRYAPLIQQLSTKYAASTAFFLVFPDRAESPGALRAYVRDFGYTIPALRDTEHALVKKAGARVTPEAAVFNAKRELVYRGRIDDLYPALGKSRHAASTHELADAIEAAVKGVAPPRASAEAVGCVIADLQ
jgi:thiol-disulfide isomerase/thioredoxin